MPTRFIKLQGPFLNKVPDATLLFWLTLMIVPGAGMAGSEILKTHLGFSLIGMFCAAGGLLAGTLWAQLRMRRYVPWVYWSALVLLSIFAKLITDTLTVQINVPLALSMDVFSIALIATFIGWKTHENSISTAAINTRPSEIFYWIAVLIALALGTTLGSWIAESHGLSSAKSALLFASIITGIAFGALRFRGNPIAAFWMVYIFAHPFGASCWDLLSEPMNRGGLGMGTTGTNVLFLILLVALVCYATKIDKGIAKAQHRGEYMLSHKLFNANAAFKQQN